MMIHSPAETGSVATLDNWRRSHGGMDVDVAWRDGGRMVATGNSFAAPHVAGFAALVRAKHPAASPFEVKAILAASASEPPALGS